MAEISSIRAVLLAKDLTRMVDFYSEALGMSRGESDEHHAVLQLSGFDLVIHQIPIGIADQMEISDPEGNVFGVSQLEAKR